MLDLSKYIKEDISMDELTKFDPKQKYANNSGQILSGKELMQKNEQVPLLEEKGDNKLLATAISKIGGALSKPKSPIIAPEQSNLEQLTRPKYDYNVLRKFMSNG